jgi:predicted GNAT family acetyltransferase
MSNSEIQVAHQVEKNRFEAQVGGYTAELTYRLAGSNIIFTHTGVPPALEGRGIGSLLVKAGLEYAREKKLKVTPLCWFVAGYIQRHAEYQDLVK